MARTIYYSLHDVVMEYVEVLGVDVGETYGYPSASLASLGYVKLLILGLEMVLVIVLWC